MKDAKANCQQSADSCTCSEGGGERQNGRKSHPSAAQLAVELVPLIGARPAPVLLVLAGGRTDTTLTAAMVAAAAAVMARVARVTMAAARTGNASDKVRDHQPLSSCHRSCPFVWLTSLRMAHAVP